MKESRSLLRRAGSGWVLPLLVAVVLFLAATVVGVLSAGDPATADEAGYRLAAESLARDGDLVLSGEDESRIRLENWAEVVRPRMKLVDRQVLRFEEPWFYPVLLAPIVVAAPRVGPAILNSLFLAIVLVAGSRSLRHRLGGSETWTVVAVIFGSVVVTYVPATLPVLFLSAVTAVALALFSTAVPSGGEQLREMYAEEPGRWHLVLRSLFAGFLLGVVAAHHVLYILLLLTPLILAGKDQRKRVFSVALVGAALALLIVWPISGLWPDAGIIPGSGQQVEVSVGSGVTGVEKAEIFDQKGEEGFSVSRDLIAWNAVYATVGSHIGVLPYFLPLVLLIAAWGGRGGGGWLLVLALVGLVGSVLIEPFDFAGLPAALGNRVFVPFYISLMWLPGRPLGQRSGLVAIVVGIAILWPLWSFEESPLTRLQRGASRGVVLDLLPYETTQRDLPVRGEVVTRDFLARSVAGVSPGGRSGHFRLAAGGRADLLVAAPTPLASVDLEFDSAAGLEIEISGGEASDMILMPDGGVVFRVLPTGGKVRHPVWWSSASHTFYRLGVAMPGASGETTFSISSAEVDSVASGPGR